MDNFLAKIRLQFRIHDGHDEVVGTLGHAPSSITLVTRVEDANAVQLPTDKPLMVLTQRTKPSLPGSSRFPPTGLGLRTMTDSSE